MKQSKIFKVGLTGGIGSGKSTVSKFFIDKGISVIDCDKISRHVLDKYPIIIEEIREKFGSEFVDEAGNLKRMEFGSYIFKSDKRRKEYEKIIIPYIKKEINSLMEELQSNGEEICIVDAPTLFEQNEHLHMDLNVVVWVDRETQMKRVKGRDKLEDEEIANRINAQISLDEKREKANFVIDNTKSIEETKAQVDLLITFINDLRGVGKAVEKAN
ncbi:dephospho-CoA kinase [Clostridium malenominatum]|uniref:Dephospho-CoA kinase n=1 Tax=Clostridium malenominatum TaxID=1539 RepID=A0ABN1J807_9CLOT